MALDFDKLSPEELLAAESAILTQRSLMQVVKTAPHGQGMASLEAVILKDGYEHLRKMMTAAAASHEGAQKKGSAAGPAPAAKPPRSNDARKKRS
jgi:hypothetical protein